MDRTGSPLLQELHRQAAAAPIGEITRTLQEVLSRRVTAFIAGVEDAKTVSRWANGTVTEVRDFQIEHRLRTSYEIVWLLINHDAAPTVRAWFIGLDPQLGDVSPAEALREGRMKEVTSAARAFAMD
jgi:hypothetical protein